jgi:hypothetical protein
MNELANATVKSLSQSNGSKRSWTADEVIAILIKQNQGETREQACKSVGRSVASFQTCVRPKLNKIFAEVSQLPESEQGAELELHIRAVFK